MNPLPARFALVMLAVSLCPTPSVARSVSLTPETLSGWTLYGTSAEELKSQAILELPAGAQLSQAISPSAFLLHLSTQPQLGESSESWPILEIGPYAVIFLREENEGQLTVFVGNDAPVTIPWRFPLDPSGRSRDSISLDLLVQPGRLSIEYSGETFELPASQEISASPELILSAGNDRSWSISELTLSLNPDAASPANTESSIESTKPVATVASTPEVGNTPIGDANSNGKKAEVLPISEATSAAPVSVASTEAGPALQLFSPPSVRHGRSDSLRALVKIKN